MFLMDQGPFADVQVALLQAALLSAAAYQLYSLRRTWRISVRLPVELAARAAKPPLLEVLEDLEEAQWRTVTAEPKSP